jgi:pimeloyl-ACP methyl ester carboxylesterase
MSQSTTEGHIELETSFGTLTGCDRGPDGPAAPLVFLQGLMCGTDVWAEVVSVLAPARRCIIVDWPFGAHPRPMRAGADLSPPGLASLVIEVLDRIGVERATLVGNDCGGVIAQLALEAAPQRLESLVLIACDAFECFPPGAYRLLFAAARIPGAMALLAASMNRPAFARSRFGFGAVTCDPAAAADWAQPLMADPLIRRDLRKLMTGASNRQTLQAARAFAGFKRPVLVVWADPDRLFPLSLGERLAAAFPAGRLVVVPESRTFIPLDQPAALSALIAEFTEPIEVGA